jgi:hypothetical protein
LTPKQLLRPSEIRYKKCTKIHLRAYRISKIFPGLYPPDPHEEGKGKGIGREGEWNIGREGEGQEGRGERREGEWREGEALFCQLA